MQSKRSYPVIILVLVLSILDICAFLPPANADNSAARTLTWSVVKTPAEGPANVIRSNSEINSMALGNGIFFCADTANNKLFRSLSGGYTFTDITGSLTLAGANLPVWSVAIAPDNPKFVVVATDNCSSALPYDGGPGQVFLSIDGGNTWQNTGLTQLGVNEYISCVDISTLYGNGFRDIFIGTRTQTNSSQVLNLKYGTVGGWVTQNGLPGAITSLKFSPNYPTDNTIVAISTASGSTSLHLGEHDTTANSTIWDVPYTPGYSSIPYPITIASVGASHVIGSGLALPNDYNAHTTSSAGCFVSVQSDTAFSDAEGRNTLTGVFYINTIINAIPFVITPPAALSPPHRISSIVYDGSESAGTLLAGEVKATPSTDMVPIYQSLNAQSFTKDAATWTSSQDFSNGYKSPTGGNSTTNLANPILAWQGGVPYCGTSSENDTIGGTAWSAGQWPYSKLTGVPLDESAFSYSFSGLSFSGQPAQPGLSGLGWNQIGLIDTSITHLSDNAAIEPQLTTGQGLSNTSTTTQGVLYLSSLNENTTVSQNFDSIWRSTSNTLGDTWERVLTENTSDNGLILRINAKSPGTTTALIAGDLTTKNIWYSDDEGQTWKNVLAGILSLRDLTFRDEGVIYVLEDYRVSQLFRGGDNTTWIPQIYINTDLSIPAHSISVPLINQMNTDLVFIGSGIQGAGQPGAYVAWTDFSQQNPQFTILKMLPQSGNVHVITDSKFDEDSMIYVGINASESDSRVSSDGSIYRWTVGHSTDWDELEPPDSAFFGVAMMGDVLYGAFNFNATTLLNGGGVDRTLDPRTRVPPPPEWDTLTDGLPQPFDPIFQNFPVYFIHEPTSLKISSNTITNSLWAIDDTPYNPNDFGAKSCRGCLWRYIDSAARTNPWPTAPPGGGLIGADPVTGRSQQIDIRWRPMQDMFGYDLLLAKDVNFTTLLSQNLNFFPVDNKTGAWVVGMENITATPAFDQWQESPGAWIPPGILEAGKSYWWKVRGSRTVTGAALHSLWSPVMFFSVKPGFAVRSNVPGPELLTPVGGVCNDCQSSVGFSWTPIKNAQKYEFTLAGDQALSKVITRIVTTTTAYKYVNKLDPGRVYFWQVKAVAPFESDPSPTGTFTVGGSQPLISWAPVPPSQLWIGVMIGSGLLILLIIALFIYNYMRRY